MHCFACRGPIQVIVAWVNLSLGWRPGETGQVYVSGVYTWLPLRERTYDLCLILEWPFDSYLTSAWDHGPGIPQIWSHVSQCGVKILIQITWIQFINILKSLIAYPLFWVNSAGLLAIGHHDTSLLQFRTSVSILWWNPYVTNKPCSQNNFLSLLKVPKLTSIQQL